MMGVAGSLKKAMDVSVPYSGNENRGKRQKEETDKENLCALSYLDFAHS